MENHLHEAMFYDFQSGLVTCRLCPHNCRLKDGQSGLCGTRKHHQGQLLTTNYGVVSSLALDPIEKKPLKHFMPGSSILSVGSYGCNLSCPFCQNAVIAKAQDFSYQANYSSAQLVEEAIRLKGRGNIGLAYTYNEPLVWYEFVYETAQLSHQQGLKNVLVSNGYINPQAWQQLLPYLDAVNIDLKAFSDDFYRKIVGGDLETVKNNIATAADYCHLEVTTLVIPGLNDQAESMQAQAQWLAAISPQIVLHLSRFFPQYKMTDKSITPAKTLYQLQAIAQEHLEYVYLGNL